MDSIVTYLLEHQLATALLIGWLLDLVLGDPAWLPHPVVYMGKWISFWEHRTNHGSHRILRGAVLAVVSILLTFLITWGIIVLLAKLSPWLSLAFQSLLVFYCLAGHTLRNEVRMVFEALNRSLEEGRHQVARIVGRDTQELSVQEVSAAALETLAENLSDGVIAPLFWCLLLGVPGMMTYKMVNTLDSMIAYHSPRYIKYGTWAAHIDDVANWIPARLTALLLTLMGWMVDKLQAPSLPVRLRFLWHFGPQHASPNSGWPEAALACLLNCRFGGPHNYFGELFPKPYIGTNPRPLEYGDMTRSIRVCLLVEVFTLLSSLSLLLLTE